MPLPQATLSLARLRPSRRISCADTTSRGATRPHSGQRCTRTASVLRTSRPHRQCWLVPAGFTSTTRRPASAALTVSFPQEGTPCRIVPLLGEHASGHAADVELFDGNELVAVNDLTRELVHEISPLIGDMLVNALQLPHGLAAADRPPLCGAPPCAVPAADASEHFIVYDLATEFFLNDRRTLFDQRKKYACWPLWPPPALFPIL